MDREVPGTQRWCARRGDSLVETLRGGGKGWGKDFGKAGNAKHAWHSRCFFCSSALLPFLLVARVPLLK